MARLMTRGPRVIVAMEVDVQDLQDAVEIDEAWCGRLVQFVLDQEQASARLVSIAIVDDLRMHELNRTYLDHDYPTDVLSFPLGEACGVDDPDPTLGEVVVSVEYARREAAERELALVEELGRYLVHGCLHLLGYDDKDPERRERMHARQEQLLAAFSG